MDDLKADLGLILGAASTAVLGLFSFFARRLIGRIDDDIQRLEIEIQKLPVLEERADGIAQRLETMVSSMSGRLDRIENKLDALLTASRNSHN